MRDLSRVDLPQIRADEVLSSLLMGSTVYRFRTLFTFKPLSSNYRNTFYIVTPSWPSAFLFIESLLSPKVYLICRWLVRLRRSRTLVPEQIYLPVLFLSTKSLHYTSILSEFVPLKFGTASSKSREVAQEPWKVAATNTSDEVHEHGWKTRIEERYLGRRRISTMCHVMHVMSNSCRAAALFFPPQSMPNGFVWRRYSGSICSM
jgi:hypothetical protein